MREPIYNYELFKKIFGLYATELWAKPEKEFLEWLNAKAEKEVKPIVYGEWIDINGIKTCNQCSAGNASAYDYFCPNCGCEMRKEKINND